MENESKNEGEANALAAAAPPEASAVQPAAAPPQASKPIPSDLTAMKLLSVTKSIVVVRALVYAAITGVMFVSGLLAGLLAIWAAYKGQAVIAFVLILFLGSGFWGLLRFARRYCLYMIKAAHVAAITEYLRTGAVPVTEGGFKGVLAFGTQKVKNNFVTANIAFGADLIIEKATRQIMRWLNKAQNLLSFIPGSQKAFAVVNFVLSTALNFIDEAVLSYIFYHTEEKNAFKKACDGLVYYAQAWKEMLMGALKVGAFIWGLRIVGYAIFFGIFWGVGAGIAGIFKFGVAGQNFSFLIGLIMGYVCMYGIQGMLIEPYATCMMIKDYHKAIAGKPMQVDLHGKLCGVSTKFKELFDKSKKPMPEPEVVAVPEAVG
ncbi:MAG: site-specific recombinase [Chitinispirillales bacterium]|jgi:hypothetical protein|nr:site-specific recombinase [Chitinispirillales bacterium]